jgi:hypothetical protein
VDGQLYLRISEEGADPERLAVITDYLRVELLQLDIEDVTLPREGDPPPGSRAFSVTSLGSLLVTLGQSAQGLRSVISAISAWLRRGGDTGRMVRLELDGDTLVLAQASAAEQERLIELFVSRHSAEQKNNIRQRKALIAASDEPGPSAMSPSGSR